MSTIDGMARKLLYLLFLASLVVSCGDIQEFINGDTSGSQQGASSVNVAALEATLLIKLNDARSANALNTVILHSGAATHARAAAQTNLNNYLNGSRGDQSIGKVVHIHYVNDGGLTLSQVDAENAAAQSLGFKVKENLYSTTDPNITSLNIDGIASDVVSEWMNSTGHRLNILSPTHFGLGVGVAVGVDGRGRLTIVISAEFVCQNC